MIPLSNEAIVEKVDPRVGYITVDQIFHGIFDQNLLKMLNGEKLTVTRYFFQGARFSGKTRNVLHFFMKAFLATADLFQTIFYVVRRNEKQLNKMKKQIFQDFNKEYNFVVKQGKDFKGGPINQLQFKDNHICFETINDDKIKIEDGGATGGTTWPNPKYIFIFFEECSQLNRGLVDQITDTIRGGEDTQKIVLYASNPWSKMHWFTRIMLENLPECKETMEKEGCQYIQKQYIDGEQAIFIRNNVLTNPHIDLSEVLKLQSYKEYNLNAYNIAYLGLCGVLEATLYSASLNKRLPVDYENFVNVKGVGRWHVGIDWGEGKSRFASPTTMHLAKIHPKFGCQVVREYTHWNNGRDTEVPEGLSTVQQFDKMIETLKQWLSFTQQPIMCFIDTGATVDFHRMLNERMWNVHGIPRRAIECVPAFKDIPIEERVLTTNVALAKGLYRVDEEQCPLLFTSLQSCRQVESDSPKEEQKFEREHEYSHWINSGAEYVLGEFAMELSKGWSEIYETIQANE